MRFTVAIVALGLASLATSPLRADDNKKNGSGTMRVFINQANATGTFDIQRFERTDDNTVSAIGVLSLTNLQGGNSVITTVAWPVVAKSLAATPASSSAPQVGPLAAAAAAPSCPILNLTLGPLDLNLLGLAIHLNQVVLNITAIPGPGNLLGNLLCAVANLLNPPSPLQQLVAALNNILAALGG